jgi:hypothetical protein
MLWKLDASINYGYYTNFFTFDAPQECEVEYLNPMSCGTRNPKEFSRTKWDELDKVLDTHMQKWMTTI